ncbi:MAG TPA: peptidylprolyl isomerase [Actinomycetota bacterium]|nr:peptidylprolyl isomerase [Actinomycetota bacterium]
MRKALLAAAVLLAAPACGNLLDPAAAVVYGEKIPMDEIQAAVDDYVGTRHYKQLAAQGDAGGIKRQYEQGRLSFLIKRAVLAPVAEERGIEVTDADVQEQIDTIIETEFENLDAFEEELKEQGLTRAELEEIVHVRLIEEELEAEVIAEARPSEEDLRAFYEGNLAEFELTRSQHILVEKKGLAERLAQRLKVAPEAKVGKLFAELARKHSVDPSAADNGGDLGFQPRGSFVEPFENAANALQPGEISDPVETEFGWHVIRVVARRTATFEQALPQIEPQLAGEAQTEAWQDFLRDLYEEAEVEVNPRYGVWDETLGQVVDVDADDIPAGEAPAPDPSPSLPEFPAPQPSPG